MARPVARVHLADMRFQQHNLMSQEQSSGLNLSKQGSLSRYWRETGGNEIDGHAS
jgi:hypothetical protein